MNAKDLYLELLKKSITDTLAAPEPDAEAGGARFMLDFLHHYIRGRAITMLPLVRLHQLQRCIEDVIARGIPGDLMEAGVWRGGAAVLMRAVLQAHGIGDRCVWAADSFQGLPQPDAALFPKEAQAHASAVMRDGFAHFAVGLDAVQANFARYGLLDAQVRFLPGWFHETLPTAPIERLAVLRLDGDYFASTRDGLVHLYDKLSVGGYLIVDDYGEDDWTHCRAAVDGFRAERGITEPMVQVDRRCWYWLRGA
ncbi:MAG TPA: TylF/MycF/NovP-related O-methyltransferase [Burkholderiaceae bacterium]|nr:TylF/MycF/NovP-related O-methyltransferase [Burkholderiaceae bacterium]